MTDLEDLWDDLPVGKPPTNDILRAGRKAAGPSASRRRRFLVRAAADRGARDRHRRRVPGRHARRRRQW